MRHLIAKLVTESVRDFAQREADRRLGFLTPQAIENGHLTGKFGSPREETQTVNLEQAIGQALQAFEDGLYLLFVDAIEKRALDDLVTLLPETQIKIVRLTALAGR